MPIQPKSVFIRQSVIGAEKIGLVIPERAELLPGAIEAIKEALDKRPQWPEVRETFLQALHQPPTRPPHRFSFHYLDTPIDPELLKDGAMIDTAMYRFPVRDAVLGVFDLPAFRDEEFSWSFSSTSQIAIVAAVRIGETIDVVFDQDFDQVFHVTKYHFPSGVPDSGYGEYAVHVSIDELTERGFRIVSSYEPNSRRTYSRLPFFFGFRVYGRAKGDPEFPIWRDLLAQSIRDVLFQRWHHALLFAAFALESFIDESLSVRLSAAGVDEAYIAHVVRVSEKRYKLYALNDTARGLTRRQIDKVYSKLNKLVFSPRNDLAHGKIAGTEITVQQAIAAIKATVEFIWDWGCLLYTSPSPRD